MTRYAEVIINLDAPLASSFHYHLPADLVDSVRPGHLVEVEFGHRVAQGVVIALDDRSPVPETKPIIAIILPEPVVSRVQLMLAEWLSETTLTPRMDCIRLMLPPGISSRADITLELVTRAAKGKRLNKVQGMLVELLAARGALRGRQIKQLLPKVDWRPAAELLVRRDILRRGSVLDAPRAHPKRVRTAQLIVGPEQVVAVLPTLGRKSKAAEVLEWLQASPDPLPSVRVVRRETRCGREHLEALAAAKQITLTPGRSLWVVSPADGTIPEMESPLLDWMRVANAAVIQSSGRLVDPVSGDTMPYAAADLDALQEANLVREIEEPESVSLMLDPKEVQEAAAGWRGSLPPTGWARS